MSDTDRRKVLISPDVLAVMATRDNKGHRLHVDWGEPDADGFYDPVTLTPLQPAAPAEGLSIGRMNDLIDAAKYIVQLGNQPGFDDEEWEQAINALEAALTPEDDR